MAKHIVTCVECGKQFDANKGGYYDKASRRYTCKSCGNKLRADNRESQTGMRQSFGAMIAKIAFGVIFVVAAFQTGSVGGVITGLAIGVALIAWSAVPAYTAKKQADANKAEALKAAEAEANRPKKCNTCGATTKGDSCEYCGAPLD